MTISQEQYSSSNLSLRNQVQLLKIQQKFRQQYLPFWKYAVFLGYNFVGLSAMAVYGLVHFRKTRKLHKERTTKPNPKQYTLWNVIKKGSKHGIIISGLYLGGMCLFVPSIFPFQIFYKIIQIHGKIDAFSIKYDPLYQETMLFTKMRKSGISQELIQQIRQELAYQKDNLIKEGGLRDSTIQHLAKAQQWYKEHHSETAGLENFI